jgi:hypothetical protein
MRAEEITFLDTDMQIFRLAAAPTVRSEARKVFDESRPTGMSAFSLFELKGNYIADLILLHKKIAKSNSLLEAYERIQSTGGRKATLMLGQLFVYLGGPEFYPNPWIEAKSQLITHLDAEIEISWADFGGSVDRMFDDFQCTRAAEEQEDRDGQWSATIPRCRLDNTRCKITNFLDKHQTDLTKLLTHLDGVDAIRITDELRNIRATIEETLRVGFKWYEGKCRKKGVGDLLIGLQSKVGKVLVSSNVKEHTLLSEPLGYLYKEFPVATIRLK